jgi:hypothetical protein
LKKPVVRFQFRRASGSPIRTPSTAMTVALQRLCEANEMQPLLSQSRSDGLEVLIEVFHRADGQPLLIHTTVNPAVQLLQGEPMKSFDNHGRLASEINTSRTSDGKTITSQTMYNTDNGRPIHQTIAVRDSQGKVTTTDVIGGKLIP